MKLPVFSKSNPVEDWINKNNRELEKVGKKVLELCESTLKDAEIQYLSITSRIKSAESAKQKFATKSRNQKYEFTDLVGIRVVVFLEHEIDLAASQLRKTFEIDEVNCVDKRSSQQIDAVGYRSLHLVATLGERRSELPEYRDLCDCKFEIQIRTALQHTWAVIEHKKNYKGAEALPVNLQRRLMILSGTLELIDREFSQIAIEADAYVSRLARGEAVEQTELSFIAVFEVVRQASLDAGDDLKIIFSNEGYETISTELRDFGICDLSTLKESMKSEKAKELIKILSQGGKIHVIGLLRDMMICIDPDRYFEKSFKHSFGVIEVKDEQYLARISGRPDLNRILRNHGIDLIPE